MRSAETGRSPVEIRIFLAAVLVLGLGTVSCASSRQHRAHPHDPRMAEDDPTHEQHATAAMTSHEHGMDRHVKWTAQRPVTSADLELVETLRLSLAKYRDYRTAIEDGFEPFLPHIAQPRYHFTSKWNGFKAAFRFNPAAPTSLLYRKTATGYELVGAMYTAPKGLSEEKLDARVPLSIGQWHAHVNICLPPRGMARQADWSRFGLKGSIDTRDACAHADGRFLPQIFGWMLHVYPYEQSPEKIWAH